MVLYAFRAGQTGPGFLSRTENISAMAVAERRGLRAVLASFA
jgi:hypothetical protein